MNKLSNILLYVYITFHLSSYLSIDIKNGLHPYSSYYELNCYIPKSWIFTNRFL